MRKLSHRYVKWLTKSVRWLEEGVGEKREERLWAGPEPGPCPCTFTYTHTSQHPCHSPRTGGLRDWGWEMLGNLPTVTRRDWFKLKSVWYHPPTLPNFPTLFFFKLSIYLAVSGLSRLSCQVECGILAAQAGFKPVSLALEGRFLTNGPQGKALSKPFWD